MPAKKSSLPFVPAIPAEAKFITTAELAGLLRKSKKSIYRLAAKNQITHIHDAGGLRFARESVEHYLAVRLRSSVTS